MGSLLPSNTFGGKGIEMFTPVGGAEPDFDVIVQGNLTVLGQEVLLPTADLVMTAGTIRGNDAVLTGPLSCTNLTAAGPITGTAATFTGEVQCGSLAVDAGLDITNLFADTASIIGEVSAGNIVSNNGVTINGAPGLTVNGPLTTTGSVSFPNAALAVASVTSAGPVSASALSAGSGVISGNLTVNGTLIVPGGIDAPPVVAGLNCSSIRFGNLLAIFGNGSTGADGQVTYITRPFTTLFTLVLTGNLNGGSTLLFNSNGANGAAGQIYAVATFSNGQRVGAGIAINMVAYAIVA